MVATVLVATTIFGFPLVVAAMTALATFFEFSVSSLAFFIAARRQSKKF
jgi:hypothetical protein